MRDDLEDLASRGRRVDDPDRQRWRVKLSGILSIGAVLMFALQMWSAISSDEVDEPAPEPTRAVAAGGALADPAAWITPDDYPPESIRAEEEGTVRVAWTVAPAGHVTGCRIVETSGFPRLDTAACTAIWQRGTYAPLPPASGPREHSRRVVWRLPRD